MTNDPTTGLAQKRCRPCEGNLPPLPPERVLALLTRLQADWHLCSDGRRIERVFRWEDAGIRMAEVLEEVVRAHH